MFETARWILLVLLTWGGVIAAPIGWYFAMRSHLATWALVGTTTLVAAFCLVSVEWWWRILRYLLGLAPRAGRR